MNYTNDFGERVFEHDLKDGIEFQLHDTQKGVTVHRAGCKHRADRTTPFDPTDHLDGKYGDDSFLVAPCARAR